MNVSGCARRTIPLRLVSRYARQYERGSAGRGPASAGTADRGRTRRRGGPGRVPPGGPPAAPARRLAARVGTCPRAEPSAGAPDRGVGGRFPPVEPAPRAPAVHGVHVLRPSGAGSRAADRRAWGVYLL